LVWLPGSDLSVSENNRKTLRQKTFKRQPRRLSWSWRSFTAVGSVVPGAECAAPDVAGDAELRVEVLAGGQVHLQLVQHDRVRHLHTHVHSG
jgi:hypothetical protein